MADCDIIEDKKLNGGTETEEVIKTHEETRSSQTSRVEGNDNVRAEEATITESIGEKMKVDHESDNKKEKEEDDDVPGDFFDDFLKDDFMAGLDIVDEESEEGINSKKKPSKKPGGKTVIISRRMEVKRPPKIDHVRKFRESPPGVDGEGDKQPKHSKHKPRSEEIKDELRELDAQLEKMRHKKPSVKSRIGGVDADNFDISQRRDPAKVRRDIQMDKQRCERRLITDIVETGLVPPGMELEVEFNDVHRHVRVEKPPGDLREILRSRRSRSHEKKRDARSRSLGAPKEKKKRSNTPDHVKDKKRHSATPEKGKDGKCHSPDVQERKEEVKHHERKARKSPKVSPKSSNRSVKSPSRTSGKSPVRQLSKSPRRSSAKPNKSSPGISAEVESLKSSVDEIIDAHLESRRAKRDKERLSSRDRSKERDRRRSPLRRSPGRKSPPMRRSPLRRSPLMRRSPLYRRSPPRRSPRRSPVRRRRSRSRSPSYRRRRRDGSHSPRRLSRRSRSRSPGRLIKREEKRSFLEELAEKLNAPTPIIVQQPYMGPPTGRFDNPMGPPGVLLSPQDAPVHPGMMPMPQPVLRGLPNIGPGLLGPVPAPVVPVAVPQQPFFPQAGPQQVTPQPQQQKFDQYDQSFFIGNDPLPTQRSFNTEQSLPSPLGNNRKSLSVERKPADLNKLFDDDKIRLSEFLAITAKPQGSSSSSAKIQEKIKVISQCQEAVKILNSNRRFAGPLIVERSNETPQPSKQKFLSPLLRNPVIQLPFTTPGLKKPVSTASDYAKFCQSLVYKVGINKSIPVVQKVFEEPRKPREVSPDVLFVPSPKTPISMQFSQVPSKAKTHNIFIQTDPQLAACRVCERRKEIGTEDTGTQVGDPKMTFSVSTQVYESDFYSTIPKSQSLASLTPAQLMGKQLRNLDGREDFKFRNPEPYSAGIREDFPSRSAPLYDEFSSRTSQYPNRNNFNHNEDIFPVTPAARFNRSPSPNSHFRDSGGSRSLSDTLRASLGNRFPPIPPRKNY